MKIFTIRNYVLALIASLILCGCASDGVSVDVYNKSDTEIHDLLLEYTGGKKAIKTILPQQNIKQKINPTGESALTIEFSLDGKNYRQGLDVYIENGYSGSLIVNIGEGGKVDFESHVKL